MALQRGEAEAFMVHARVAGAAPLDLGPPALCDSSGGTHNGAAQAAGASPPLLFEWFKVAHVWCNRSSIYPAVSSAGWYPDALLDGAYFSGGRITLEPGVAHSFFIRLRAPLAAVAGTHSIGVCFGGATGHPQAAGLTDFTGRGAAAPLLYRVNVTAQVWNLALPPLRSAFGTIFSFPYASDADGATDLARYYGGGGGGAGSPLDPAMKRRYFELLCDARIPPDNPYLLAARAAEDYGLLAACGAKRFNVLDVANAATGKTLTNYSEAQIEAVLALAAPTVANLTAQGLLDRAYVYGFDECSEAYTGAMRQVFGAVKARWPALRTVAALRWTPPADLPLDVWVNLYSLWDEGAARTWRASRAGREAWAYHCISPRPSPPTGPMRWLNTFVELPPIQGRLLSWWAATRAVDGWLYYLVDGWSVGNGHRPLQLLAGSTARTNFSAVRPNGVAVPGDRHAFSNGDGILLYPGVAGPLSSLRLEAYRDGLEDLELLRALAGRSPAGAAAAAALAARVITGFAPGVGVNATMDFSTLEAARRAAATQLTCTGASAQLPADQCAAWTAFYDALGGPGWARNGKPVCAGTRTDPCACKNYDGAQSVCNALGTAIAHVDLYHCGLNGTIPEDVGAWENIVYFRVSCDAPRAAGTAVRGALPRSMEGWQQLTYFAVNGNMLSGGVLPALPFARMTGCFLGQEEPRSFLCPWPAGATAVCGVTDADCAPPQLLRSALPEVL
jgi:hypothetical protein